MRKVPLKSMLSKSDFCFFPNFLKSQQKNEILSPWISLQSMNGIGMFLDRNVGSRDFSTVDVIDDFQQLLYHSKNLFERNERMLRISLNAQSFRK